jgi:hypothetical protein
VLTGCERVADSRHEPKDSDRYDADQSGAPKVMSSLRKVRVIAIAYRRQGLVILPIDIAFGYT